MQGTCKWLTSSSGYFEALSSKFPRVMWMSVHTVLK